MQGAEIKDTDSEDTEGESLEEADLPRAVAGLTEKMLQLQGEMNVMQAETNEMQKAMDEMQTEMTGMQKEIEATRMEKEREERWNAQAKERKEARVENNAHLDPRSHAVLEKLHKRVADEGGWLEEDEPADAAALRERLTHMHEGRFVGLKGWDAEMYGALSDLGFYSNRAAEVADGARADEEVGHGAGPNETASRRAERLRLRVAELRRESVRM
jgi:hypothetical protein